MYEYYFTFRSMTMAQYVAIELSKQGIAGTFLRSPKAVSELGCGYAVRVSRADGRRTAAALRFLGIRFEKVVELYEDGSARGIWL